MHSAHALLAALLLPTAVSAQHTTADTTKATILVPDAVWDGVADAPQRGWVVVVRGQRTEAAGPADRIGSPAGAERTTLS